MRKGRVLATILAATMLISTRNASSVYMAATSDVPSVEKTTIEQTSTDDSKIAEYRKHLNYRDDSNMNFDFSFEDETESGFQRNWGVLPASYSSSAYVDWEFEKVNDYITPVKDQNPYGACWAFSTIAAAESSYIINEGITDVESIDFNEYHLVHYTYDTPADLLGLFGGDTNLLLSGDTFLDAGGNNEVTAGALANWVGVSDSTEFTVDNVEGSNSDALGFEDVAHLENAYFVAMPDMTSDDYTTDMNAVKSMLMKYGAMAVSYYSDSQGGDEFDGYYYYPTEYGTNHAVTLVGWDDTVPAESFATTAPGDGAWLIKNSWSDYGTLGGYFWISYYDATLADTAYVYDMVPADNYDNNYQYDGSNGNSYMGYMDAVVFANAFVADSAETLEAVGFYTYDVNMDYEVRVYTGLEASEAPQYGELVLTQTGTEVYAGFHTVDLNSSINIEQGERYAVVVTLSKPDYYCYAGVDATLDYGWIGFQSYAKAGESYMGYSIDSLEDLNPENTEYADGYSIRLKAYTNEGATGSVLVNSITFAYDQTTTTLRVGNTLQITATVNPSNATNKVLTWSSSNTSVATVDANGKVTAVSVGTATITATAKDGSGESASCTVTVKQGYPDGLNEYTDGKLYYFKDSQIDTTYNGVADYKGDTWYVKNGAVDTTVNGLKQVGDIWYLFANGKVNRTTTLASINGKWWYVENGQINFNYDGVAAYGGKTWYIENGQVDFGKNGIHQRGDWYYFKDGYVNTGFTGLTNSTYGWWYIENGKITFNYTGLVQYGGSWWYVKGSNLNFKYDGVADYGNATWYVEDSKVDFGKNGLFQRGGTWYLFKGGQVNYNYNGLTNSSVGWWYIEDGIVTFEYTGLTQYGGSWWYVKNSNLNFKYDGVADYNNATWYVEDSKVDFGKNGLFQRGGTWYLFKGGQVNYNYNGLTNSSVGWWYIEDGIVTFEYTGLTQYGGSWWYVKNSNLNFKYDGVATYGGKLWYVENSKVDFSKNGLQLRSGTWYLFKGGAVNPIDSVEYYGGSWWYVDDGVLDFNYNGLGSNASGTWYIKKGKVDFSYNGTYEFKGETYNVVNGKATLVG